MAEMTLYASRNSFISSAEAYKDSTLSGAVDGLRVGPQEVYGSTVSVLEFPIPAGLYGKLVSKITLRLHVDTVVQGPQGVTTDRIMAYYNDALLTYGPDEMTWNRLDGSTDILGQSVTNNNIEENAQCYVTVSFAKKDYPSSITDRDVRQYGYRVRDQIQKTGTIRLLVISAYNTGFIARSIETAEEDEQRPQIIVTYDSNPTLIDPLFEQGELSILPRQGTTIDVEQDRLFHCNSDFGSDADGNVIAFIVIGGYVKNSSRLIWREKGSPETQVTEGITEGEYLRLTVPKNTFPRNREIEWYITSETEDGALFGFGEYGKPLGFDGPRLWFITGEPLSSATAVYPKDIYVDARRDNIFEWTHTIPTGTMLTGSDLEYSLDQTVWLPLAAVDGRETAVEIPADTLPGGTVYWRVRTYNAIGEAGFWSDPASIFVIGPPSVPVLAEIEGIPRPVIRWTAASQDGWQIQILQGDSILIDSGERAGPDKQFIPEAYLKNGEYTVRVRAKSSTGVWSDWGGKSLIVAFIPPEVPKVVYAAGNGFVRISVENSGSFAKLYLLRDGIPVSKFTGEIYDDYAASASQKYIVRGVTEDDLFADSSPVVAGCRVTQGAYLASVGALGDLYKLRLRRGEKVSFDWSDSFGGKQVHYAGRAYPVYYFPEFLDQSFTLDFAVKTPSEEYARIVDLLRTKQTLLYRDRYGEKRYCAAMSFNTHRDWYATNFTINCIRVDYVEKIPYDAKDVSA